jgi:hypothetical protein
MYGNIDENWASGDNLIDVLWVFFVGKTISSWVVWEISSGEINGAGMFYNI